jgi:hypothetical protein
MAALHDETRSRWEQYPPDEFINAVLRRALGEQISTTSAVIHVYTQIAARIPATANLKLANDEPVREVFYKMRGCIADMQGVVHDDRLMKRDNIPPRALIEETIQVLAVQAGLVRFWAESLMSDPAGTTALPQLNDKRLADLAIDILTHVQDIRAMLEFAQAYAARLVIGAA